MGLLDDLQKAVENRLPSVKCYTCSLLETLPAEESAGLQKLLDDPKIHKSQVARVLQNHGHQITGSSLTRHVRGDCVTKR
jgi:hypothetical protein